MPSALALIQQTGQRLARYKQLNVLGIFLPLTITSWVAGYFVSKLLELPHTFAILPTILCGVGLGIALWKIRMSDDAESIAALLDNKMHGQERFLTLVSTSHRPPSLLDSTLYPVVQHQAEQLSKTFLLEQDLPFILNRQVPWSIMGAVISLLVLFFFPHVAEYPRSSLLPFFQEQEPSPGITTEVTALEKTAQFLMSPSSTPEEQRAGAQLSTLAQQLKDPSLPASEKRKLIEETQKRLSLDMPLPQLFPFDLKIFAGKGKEKQNAGEDGDSLEGGEAQLAKTNQNLEQLKQSFSSQMDNESEQNGQRGKNEDPQPHPDGGSIAFNFPPQPPNQQSSSASPQSSGNRQSKVKDQTPSQTQTEALEQRQGGITLKVDPNRPGENPTPQSQSQRQGRDLEKPGKEQGEKEAGGTTIGAGKGERFLKPGDNPGGGFLTKDAHFIRVRVPMNREGQGEGDTFTANTNRTIPKVPYSNTPLKEGTPNLAQDRQPIPLEYREILAK